MRTPPLPPFDTDSATPAQALAAVHAYIAYFGRYTVDASRQTVTHHVEGSLSPDYVGTDQARPYILRGDTLEIRVTEGGWRFRRVLVRERERRPSRAQL
jgi:hypothetical protein